MKKSTARLIWLAIKVMEKDAKANGLKVRKKALERFKRVLRGIR